MAYIFICKQRADRTTGTDFGIFSDGDANKRIDIGLMNKWEVGVE